MFNVTNSQLKLVGFVCVTSADKGVLLFQSHKINSVNLLLNILVAKQMIDLFCFVF